MAEIYDVSDATFEAEVLKSQIPVLVDFWAPWCGPCRRMAPILDELAGELGDGIKIVKLNTDDNPQAPGTFGVQSIPTLILLKEGQEVERFVGVKPKRELKAKIEASLNS